MGNSHLVSAINDKDQQIQACNDAQKGNCEWLHVYLSWHLASDCYNLIGYHIPSLLPDDTPKNDKLSNSACIYTDYLRGMFYLPKPLVLASDDIVPVSRQNRSTLEILIPITIEDGNGTSIGIDHFPSNLGKNHNHHSEHVYTPGLPPPLDLSLPLSREVAVRTILHQALLIGGVVDDVHVSSLRQTNKQTHITTTAAQTFEWL